MTSDHFEFCNRPYKEVIVHDGQWLYENYSSYDFDVVSGPSLSSPAKVIEFTRVNLGATKNVNVSPQFTFLIHHNIGVREKFEETWILYRRDVDTSESWRIRGSPKESTTVSAKVSQ